MKTLSPYIAPGIVANTLDYDEYLRAACKVLNQPIEKVKTRCRTQEYVRCRHIALYLSRGNDKETFMRIGGKANRDHATVIHAIKSIKDALDVEPGLKDTINQIRIEARFGGE